MTYIALNNGRVIAWRSALHQERAVDENEFICTSLSFEISSITLNSSF